MRAAPLIALLLIPIGAGAQISSETSDGGSVVTDLGFRIKINEGSSLRRQWVRLNDARCPVRLGPMGVTIRHDETGFRFVSIPKLEIKEPVSAVEVRFVLFNAFGDRMETLSAKWLKDLSPMQLEPKDLSGVWYASDSDVLEFLTSVCFVAQARTEGGLLWAFDAEGINEEIRKLRLKLSAGGLEPSKQK